MVSKKTLKRLLRKELAKRDQKIVSTSFRHVRDIHNLGRDRHLDVNANEYTNDFVRLSLLDLAVEEIKIEEHRRQRR